MPATIEWFGTTTFRVHTGGPVLFFDAYLDRVPGLDPVGLSTAEVAEADFVFVSHAHFDHLYGADALARRALEPHAHAFRPALPQGLPGIAATR